MLRDDMRGAVVVLANAVAMVAMRAFLEGFN